MALSAPATAEATGTAPRVGRRPRWLSGVLGVVVVLALWSLLGLFLNAGGAVPTPWAVVSGAVSDGPDLYLSNASVTLTSAATGFVWGNVLALALAAVVMLVPALEQLVTQLAVISYCLPLTAIGPVVLVVFAGRTPSVFLAALAVFFTTLVGALVGLRAADRASLDLVAAYGGGRWQQLRRVRAVSALPAVLAALKLAAPAAMLGAIIGEYLGGVDSGLGVVLTSAQQQLAVPRTWGLMIATGALAGAGYLVFAVVSRLATPWAAGESAPGAGGPAAGAGA